MSCRRTQAELAAYIDNELSEPLALAITQHIANCPRCEAQLARFQALHQSLRTWEDPPISTDTPEFRDRLSRRIEELEGSSGKGLAVGVEAVARFRADREREGRMAEWSGLREVGSGVPVSNDRFGLAFGSWVRWLWAVVMVRPPVAV